MSKFEKISAHVLVLDQSNTLSFAAAVDPMRAANRHARQTVFEWEIVTPREQDVTLTSGINIPCSPLNRVQHCDFLLIIASFDIFSQSTPALHASLRRLAQKAKFVMGVDGGPWLMAQAGLLEGHSATVHWEDIQAFEEAFPHIDTKNTRYQISDNRLTSAGATPTLELMLALIEQLYGAELAKEVAASFVLDQSPAPSAPQSRDPDAIRFHGLVMRAQKIMESNLEDPLPMPLISRELGVSARVLQAHFQRQLKRTAQQHYLQLRLKEARRLVLGSDKPLLDIAVETGFSSQSSFSRAFKNYFGSSARDMRRLR